MEAKIIIGGGCFWCTEAIFKELKGVHSVVSGYSGGETDDPTYYAVCNGTTGHAEVIEVTYDSSIISFADLVAIHLTTHDPTTLNRQGADRGTQYRSIIFYNSDQEKKIIEKVITEVQKVYNDPIVTEIAPTTTFFIAEPNHQNYYSLNSMAGYCQAVIAPKLTKFRQLHRQFLK